MASIESLPKACDAAVRKSLANGAVIPAHPLALKASRQLDERRQRGLSRYYLAAGAGGLAVGVHTTQFQIHDPKVGLLKPVLALAAEEMDRADLGREVPVIRVAGICGDTQQAVEEAALARELGYHFGLVSLSRLRGAPIGVLLDHCRAVSEVISVFGFYLQPRAGGIDLSYRFWRAFCEIDNVAAIKVAAFDRYRTLSVVRAVAESGRDDIALYTGNDDNILPDLLSQHQFTVNGELVTRRFVGGLLGQWAVWTSRAVEHRRRCCELAEFGRPIPADLLRLGVELTDANSAIFDAAANFRGCVPGINEVLRRQGLLAGNWCLDENERLSPGQALEITRISSAYPHLTDDAFVAEGLDAWLAD